MFKVFRGLSLVFCALLLSDAFHIQLKRPNIFAKLFKKIIQPHYSCKCGIPNRTGRFLGGSDLTPHEFPWLALIMTIGVENMRYQTATLINDRYILSSATQLFWHSPYLYKVALGYHLMCQNELTSTIYSVQEIIIHPAFYHATSLNNIALLKISVPVLFSRHITPICLPTPDAEYGGKVGTLASWFSSPPFIGTTEMSSTSEMSSESENADNQLPPQNNATGPPIFPRSSTPPYGAYCIPHKIGLPIHTGQKCSVYAGINSGCIGISGGSNTYLCQSDAGSGIYYPSLRGYYELVGVLSNEQWCIGEGAQFKTTTAMVGQSSDVTEPIDGSGGPEDVERRARFLGSLNFPVGIPTFAKITAHLEWILMNTKDALYCHKT